MASTLVRSEFDSDLWPDESSGAKLRPVDLDRGGRSARRRPSFRKRALRTLLTFCLGIAATLGWQSYGDVARELIANSTPQLAWLAPPAGAVEQAAPETVASAAPAIAAPVASAPDPQQLNATSLGLAAVRQSVDRLAAQLTTNQQQMASEIAKLQVAEQDILQKVSAPPQVSAPPPRPAAAPARKPVALMPPPPSTLQTTPLR
jgi:pyruvate/2-oxoglutarate dehydrogenase complex dihydrolipoamide acyltransferase (E2) component